MSVVIDGTSGVTTPGVVNTAGETIATTLAVTGATNLSALTTTGNTILGDASTDTLNVGNGGLVKDASGNVGIGTASPSEKFVTYAASGYVAMSLYSGANNLRLYANGTESGIQSVTSGNSIGFQTNSGAGTAERMRIDSSGNLLVGTTTQFNSCKQALVFDGSVNIGLAIKNSNVTIGQTFTGFYNSAGTNIGSITQNATTTVAYSTSSDYRLKENIAPMTGALSKVALLKPVTYAWKQEFGGERGQGFIAHELQAVVPDCVTGKKDDVDAEGKPKYQGIDTSFLVATLTAAIQELKAIVDAQAVRIAALES